MAQKSHKAASRVGKAQKQAPAARSSAQDVKQAKRIKALEASIEALTKQVERIEYLEKYIERLYSFARFIGAELEESKQYQKNIVTSLNNRFTDLQMPSRELRSPLKDSIQRILDDGRMPVTWQVGNAS
jgi:predicted RNase H-like nuclease (RuvC/YqgF family)